MKKILFTTLVCLLALASCSDNDEPKPDERAIETFTVNGVSFKMVKVEGGSLTMNMKLPECSETTVLNQDTTIDVTIADYSIGQTEVTQALWLAVMGINPSYFSTSEIYDFDRDREYGDDLSRPVECVSWEDCNAFMEKLNELTGQHFRIPTEAEWEFAARGGNKTHGYLYAGSDSFDEVAWCGENSDYMTHPVGQKKPNELGLYDMSGNVWEWCLEREVIPYIGTNRIIQIIRGGSFYEECIEGDRDHEVHECTVRYRGYLLYSSKSSPRGGNVGLRLAM